MTEPRAYQITGDPPMEGFEVLFAPCLYQHIKGPGRARRAPPGTLFRFAGTMLKRSIEYNARGQAVLRVRVMSEEDSTEAEVARREAVKGNDSLETSVDKSTTAQRPDFLSNAHTSAARGGGANTATSPLPHPLHPHSQGLSSLAQLPSGSLAHASSSSSPSPSGGGAAAAGTFSFLKVEEIMEADQQEQFVNFMTTFPVLRVLPPLSLQRQRYRHASPTPPSLAMPAREEGNYRSTGQSIAAVISPNAEMVSGSSRVSSPNNPSVASLSSPYTSHSAATTEYFTVAATASVMVSVGRSCDDPNTLRSVLWGGCRPPSLRAAAWRLLTDYAPAAVSRQRSELARKRAQYIAYVTQYWRSDGYYKPRSSSGSSYIASGGGGGGSGSSAGVGESGRGSDGVAVATAAAMLAPHEEAILRQIALDLPRHQAPVFHCTRTAASLARCLFLWSQRHPAVGYVQGIDDIVSSFYQVFLTDALRQRAQQRRQEAMGEDNDDDDEEEKERKEKSGTRRERVGQYTDSQYGGVYEHMMSMSTLDPFCFGAGSGGSGNDGAAVDSRGLASSSLIVDEYTVSTWSRERLDAALDDLPDGFLTQVEADTYWCAGRLLSYLQDNFTHGQFGIMKCAKHLEAVLCTVDPALWTHLETSGVGLLDTCFQWFHCLLARELPLGLLLQLWDTYLTIDGEEIVTFHVYMCAALAVALREKVVDAPLDVIMTTLKNPMSALFPEEEEEEIESKQGSVRNTKREERQSDWLKMILADAYRMWRQYPQLVKTH